MLLREIHEKKRSSAKNCAICKIPLICCNYEKDLNKNMFNEVFLWDYHKRLIFHLQEIFETDKTALCCFLDAEYHYWGRDWRTGET